MPSFGNTPRRPTGFGAGGGSRGNSGFLGRLFQRNQPQYGGGYEADLMQSRPAYGSSPVGSFLPPTYYEAAPAVGAGSRAAAKTLSDPYQLPEGTEAGVLQGTEDAYQVARQRTGRGFAGQAHGGEMTGVASRGMGNVETARARGMSDQLRALAELRARLGDERLRGIYLPMMAELGRMYGTAGQLVLGAPKRRAEGGGFLQSLLPIAGTVAGSIFGGPAGAAIGGAAGSALGGAIGGGTGNPGTHMKTWM